MHFIDKVEGILNIKIAHTIIRSNYQAPIGTELYIINGVQSLGYQSLDYTSLLALNFNFTTLSAVVPTQYSSGLYISASMATTLPK